MPQLISRLNVLSVLAIAALLQGCLTFGYDIDSVSLKGEDAADLSVPDSFLTCSNEGECFAGSCCSSEGGLICVDLESSVDHCGACNTRCGAGEVCAEGRCACGATLGIGEAACDDSDPDLQCCQGECRLISSDAANCGGCGLICEDLNVDEVICREGVCQPTCARDFGSCEGNPSAGCETPLSTPRDCGACGTQCASSADCAQGECRCAVGAQAHCEAVGPFHSDATCEEDGRCTLSCIGQRRDCDLQGENSCEVDITSDPEHCGGCQRTCEQHNTLQVSCADSLCVPICQEGFASCDGDPWNGCETNTKADIDHCGACEIGCGPSESCDEGNCQ